MTERRAPIQIVADILRLEKASKTKISLSADIGHSKLNSYLLYLVYKGFLDEQNGSGKYIYQVTPRGRELLEIIDRVTECLSTSGTVDISVLNNTAGTSLSKA